MTTSSLAAVIDAATVGADAVPVAQVPAVPPAAAAAALAAAKAEGVTEGAKAERARIQAIVSSDEAKGRETMAAHLAFSTGMDAEGAIALLKASPTAAAPTLAVGSRLDAAMRDPQVPTGAGASAPSEAKQIEAGLSAAIDAMIQRHG